MMDTDAIYSAVCDYGRSCRRRDAMDEVDHLLRIRMLLKEADEEHKSLLAENERLVDEVNDARKETSEQARVNGMGAEREARLMAENAELKAKLTEKASLLRGCYAADHKQKQRIEELIAELDALKAENERLTNCLKKANDQAEDFERRWYLADMELERIKANPVHQFRKSRCADWFDGYPDPTDGGGPYETRTLYALGSKYD